jgi:hypothetical protein
MSTSGFRLIALRVEGQGRTPAEINFARGLNVISGASDTGKSYVLSLINYLLGAGTMPEDIPEAHGYTSAFLTLHAIAENKAYTLERALRGGDLRLYEGGPKELRAMQLLKPKHDPKRQDTVSAFLLGLSGLSDKKILLKKRPIQTRSVSFRDISDLILATEERIITKLSPIHSANPVERTPESAVFRLMLTGADDGAIISQEDIKLSRSRQEGKVQLLSEMVTRQELELHRLRQEHADPADSVKQLEQQIDAALALREEHQHTIHAMESDRRAYWNDLKKIENRLTVVEGLLERFKLLDAHYESDLNRLASIVEADEAFSMLQIEYCPMCGAANDAHQHENVSKDYGVADVREGAIREAEKIQVLRRDLQSARQDLAGEYDGMISQQKELKIAVDSASKFIQDELMPKLRTSSERLGILVDLRSRIQHLEHAAAQAVALREQYDDALREWKRPAPKAPKVNSTVRVSDTEGFCLATQELLRAWRFPELDRVVFSEEAEDLVISARHRSSRGKGIRALTYAAFLLGLMRYCIEQRRPHPGIVLMDSPLVAYKEPDPDGDNLSPDVKDAFYRSLANGHALGQIIVCENQDPPSDISANINYIHFSKNREGRYGFYPV